MPRPKQRPHGMWLQPPRNSFVPVGGYTAGDMIDPEDPALREILDAARRLEELGFDIRDPAVTRRAIDVGRRDHCLELYPDITSSPAGMLPIEGEFVYYMRIGNRVKIGYTSNLARRISSINPEELMATEPGTMLLEKARHVQFSQLRTHGEWFRLEGPLVRHIERLKAGGPGEGAGPRGSVADGPEGPSPMDQAV